MQLTFGDAEYNGKRKRTRREVFLAEMDQVVPWKGLLALIEPQYPTSGQPWRQPYRLEALRPARPRTRRASAIRTFTRPRRATSTSSG
ncbi:hypothetical protein [Xanthomonas vasicola]|uniref:hypothetical protein n=1 Tax=Xanthomonas vasicola TaxID=56459 RepID=UPI0039C93BD2